MMFLIFEWNLIWAMREDNSDIVFFGLKGYFWLDILLF